MLTFPHAFALREGDPAPPGVAFARQVHGTAVIVVNGSRPAGETAGLRGDALVATASGVAVGVRTADCVPILIEAPEARLCAAVHAGWRGLRAGVIEAAVAELRRLGARPGGMRAAQGPSLGPCCFEVGPEVAAQFRGFSRPGPRRDHVDLRAAARARLAALDVAIAAADPPCTLCHPDRYCSYRRDGSDTPQHRHWIAVP